MVVTFGLPSAGVLSLSVSESETGIAVAICVCDEALPPIVPVATPPAYETPVNTPPAMAPNAMAVGMSFAHLPDFFFSFGSLSSLPVSSEALENTKSFSVLLTSSSLMDSK